jgi:hypothetical protein
MEEVNWKDWKRMSEQGEVCGILGCNEQPTIQCQHCRNWYCETHKWVLATPGHPQVNTPEGEVLVAQMKADKEFMEISIP